MSGKGADRKIDYIEFNVADIAKSKAFYGGAFGWTFTDYGPEYCEFQDGRLTGGFTTLAPVNAAGGPAQCPAAMEKFNVLPPGLEYGPGLFSSARAISDKLEEARLQREWTVFFRDNYRAAAGLAGECAC